MSWNTVATGWYRQSSSPFYDGSYPFGSRPDFTVSSDAEWDSVFSNSDAVLSSKTIAVSGSSITDRDITGRAFLSRLTITSADASSLLPKLDISSTDGVRLSGLRMRNDNPIVTGKRSTSNIAVGDRRPRNC